MGYMGDMGRRRARARGSIPRRAIRRTVGLAFPALLVVLLTALLVVSVATPPPVGAAAAPQITRNINYGGGDDPATVLDTFVPTDGRTNRPAVVLVHGGGWVGGDKSALAPDALALAQQGFVTFSINYGLDDPRWPDELDDVQTAVRWVQDHSSTYALDPGRVGLLGSSAGGNLVMLVATLGVGDGHPPVKAVASWSGPADLTTLAITNVPGDDLLAPVTVPIPGADVPAACVDQVGTCIGTMAPAFVQAFMGCTLPECPEQYRDASPVYGVSGATPPMLLAGAETDLVPMSQNYAMANALRAARVASSLLLVPGTGHAESYRSVAIAPTTAFFQQYLVDDASPQVSASAPPTTAAGSAALPALGADGRFAVPTAPLAAAPRTGVIGFAQRNIRWVFRAGLGLLGALLLVLLVRARRRRLRAGSPRPTA